MTRVGVTKKKYIFLENLKENIIRRPGGWWEVSTLVDLVVERIRSAQGIATAVL